MRTFFDSGPPFEYYEVFTVESAEGGGTRIERIILTPGEDPCVLPAKVETATASVQESVADLLRHENPCSIPEKQLKREQKRRDSGPVFSGSDVVMQVSCGGQVRRIQMAILDRDLFDSAPRTSEHTSWTMDVLRRMGQATGPGVWQKPMIALADERPPTPIPNTGALNQLARGQFDALFQGAPHKPSAIYAEARNGPAPPTVSLSSSAALRPVSKLGIAYPELARLARVDAEVSISLKVAEDGSVAEFGIAKGHPLFDEGVTSAVRAWKFPPDAAGQEFAGVIQFKTNCPPYPIATPKQTPR